jgi:septum site-determining protein MinD
MLSIADVEEILAIKLKGVIPESQAVLKASNQGIPVILDDQSDAGQAYSDTSTASWAKRNPCVSSKCRSKDSSRACLEASKP